MYARVSAKRAKLLDQRDYDNLLKMSSSEIARNLEEKDYKKEINELGSKYDGARLLELALARNLSNTLQHLIKISPEELEDLIKTYLRRYDIVSLKRLLRWKNEGEKGEISDLLTPVSGYTYEELEELSKKDFEEIINEIRFENSYVDYQDYINAEDDLKQIEKNLDQAYFDELGILADKIGNKHLRSFIKQEINYENLKIALRLKKYGVEEEKIREQLLQADNGKLVEKVIKSEDLEEAIKITKQEEDLQIDDSARLEDIEHALEVNRLQKALRNLHQEPLGITSIIGYIVAKITEVKNLRMLIRAKETGVQNRETIRQNLVVA